MNTAMRQLLAETALMATGIHHHTAAETIADSLAQEQDTAEVVAMIRAMSLMNRGKYQQAEQLLTPWCSTYPCLISFAALAAGKAGQITKAENWLIQAEQVHPESQAFATSFAQELKNFL